MKKKMPDHIDEYFTKIEGTKEAFHSRQLFEGNEKDIDLKTDISDQEISLINTMFFNDKILMECGLKPIYSKFLYKFMRLKVSKDRLSRGEFVQINKNDMTDNALNLASNLKNMTDVRK